MFYLGKTYGLASRDLVPDEVRCAAAVAAVTPRHGDFPAQALTACYLGFSPRADDWPYLRY